MKATALLAMIALILVVLLMYWLPSIVGYRRHSPDIVTVVVTNALLGWTIVGWLIAMFLAARGPAPATALPRRAAR